jgi:hypothetical protein
MMAQQHAGALPCASRRVLGGSTQALGRKENEGIQTIVDFRFLIADLE